MTWVPDQKEFVKGELNSAGANAKHIPLYLAPQRLPMGSHWIMRAEAGFSNSY